jgi:hypothetical protein
VAAYENGNAAVGLKHIPADSDFYHLYGKDNLVLLFYTERYPEQPLVIKGCGCRGRCNGIGGFCGCDSGWEVKASASPPNPLKGELKRSFKKTECDIMTNCSSIEIFAILPLQGAGG